MNLRVFYLYKTVGFGWLRQTRPPRESTNKTNGKRYVWRAYLLPFAVGVEITKVPSGMKA